MSKIKWILLPTIVIVAFGISNCGNGNGIKQTPIGTIQATIIDTITEEISPTVKPKATETPKPPIIPTFSSTATIIQTQTPDIRLAQGKGNLFSLVIKCDEPCFWGIIPDKTSFIEAKNIFQQVGLNLSITTPDHYATSFSLSNTLRADVIIRSPNSIVTNVRIVISGLDQVGINKNLWSAYFFENVLNMYGIPTKIGFFVDPPHEPPYNTGKVFLTNVLFYENQNLIIEYYGGLLVDKNGIYEYCPGQIVPKSISIWFGKNPENAPDPNQFVGLDDANTLNNSDFVRIVLQNPQLTCVDLKVSAFKN